MIVDQVIEKVSFCSPDRNCDKGFAYICRDGTTRRWLCHCFLSKEDSGKLFIKLGNNLKEIFSRKIVLFQRFLQ